MNFRSLSLIVLCHGIVAIAFSTVFLLEALGISLPLLSLQSQHSNFLISEFSIAACLFASVAIATFAAYEVLFFPR